MNKPVLVIKERGKVEGISIYYRGMYRVACSANMLLWVWQFVALKESYLPIKEMAERVVADVRTEGDFAGDANDYKFATFVRAIERRGWTHGDQILCVRCAVNQSSGPVQKKRRWKGARKRATKQEKEGR